MHVTIESLQHSKLEQMTASSVGRWIDPESRACSNTERQTKASPWSRAKLALPGSTRSEVLSWRTRARQSV